MVRLAARVATPLSPASLLRSTLRVTPLRASLSAPLATAFSFHALSSRSPLHSRRRLLSPSTSALPDPHTNRRTPPFPGPSFSARKINTRQSLSRPQRIQTPGQHSLLRIRIPSQDWACIGLLRAQSSQARVTSAVGMGAQAGEAQERTELGEAEIAAIKKELQEKAEIILGSSSYSRQTILREEMGLDFTILKANIDEKAIRFPDPSELVVALAKAKADAIIAKIKAQESDEGNGTHTPSDGRTPLLITSDQVVVYEGQILEKPESPEQAREYIRGYGRAPGGTVGATMVTNLVTGWQKAIVDTTLTYFDPIPEDSIEKLIKEGLVFYCAGALCVEHQLIAPLVTRMEGTTDAVMGLPKQTTWSLLRDALHS